MLNRYLALIFAILSVLFILPVTSNSAQRVAVTASGHPSLLCSATDLPKILARLGRKPYENWWASAIQVAKPEPIKRNQVDDQQMENARRARHAAFCYLITGDEAFAEIALDRLNGLPKMEPSQMDGKSHLKLAQTGRDYAEAYDILLPWLQATHPDELGAITEKLRYIGWELREFGPNWYGVHKNNHGIRQFSGLGLVAMALRDDPAYADEASTWLDYAISHCLDHLRYQICDPVEGGFAEGFGYFEYSGEIMWDFFYALKNVTGRDLWGESDIRALHIYAARAQMPTGCRPMFDDASYGYFPLQLFCDAYPDIAGLFAGRYRARQAAWDAGYGELKNDGSRIGPSDDYIMSIIHYDDSVKPVDPQYASLEVLEKAGDAVFRAGDGPEAIYLNMRIEDARATFNGGGHDQADGLSFFLQAYGEDLMLDPGYIKWEERDKVAPSENHNMVTVDNTGPAHLPGNLQIEGFVEVTDWGMEPNPYVEARTGYRGALFTRSIEFVDDKFFIVRDTATSDKSRTFTLNLHGHNNPDAAGSFLMKGHTATWVYGRGKVACFVIAEPTPTSWRVEKDENSFAYGEWTEHNVLRVDVSAKSAKFITVVVPFKKLEAEPVVVAKKDDGCMLMWFDGKTYDICFDRVSDSPQS